MSPPRSPGRTTPCSSPPARRRIPSASTGCSGTSARDGSTDCSWCPPGTTTPSCAPRSRWASRWSSSTGPASGLIADTVLLDNRGGSRAAVQRLLDAGHRRIAVLLDSIGIYTMRERLAGAQEALAEAGMPYDEALVRDGVRDPVSAAKATAEMLDQPRSAHGVLHPQQPHHRRRAAGAVAAGQRRRAGRLRRLRALPSHAASVDRRRLRRTRVRAHRGRVALRASQPWTERNRAPWSCPPNSLERGLSLPPSSPRRARRNPRR